MQDLGGFRLDVGLVEGKEDRGLDVDLDTQFIAATESISAPGCAPLQSDLRSVRRTNRMASPGLMIPAKSNSMLGPLTWPSLIQVFPFFEISTMISSFSRPSS